jgi:hypothetical protein
LPTHSTPSDPDAGRRLKRNSGLELPRDWAPLWQRDMPGDLWLIGACICHRIRQPLQDRLGGSLEGGSGLLLRSQMLGTAMTLGNVAGMLTLLADVNIRLSSKEPCVLFLFA